MLPPKRDRAKVAIGQLASKAFFSGEASGFHIARLIGTQFQLIIICLKSTIKHVHRSEGGYPELAAGTTNVEESHGGSHTKYCAEKKPFDNQRPATPTVPLRVEYNQS